MNKNLTTTNQNAKLALTKSKKLLNITKNLLEDEDTNSIFIIQKFFINKLILDDSEIKDKYFKRILPSELTSAGFCDTLPITKQNTDYLKPTVEMVLQTKRLS